MCFSRGLGWNNTAVTVQKSTATWMDCIVYHRVKSLRHNYIKSLSPHILYMARAPLNPHPRKCYAAAHSRPVRCSRSMDGHCLSVAVFNGEVTRQLIDIFNNRLEFVILNSTHADVNPLKWKGNVQQSASPPQCWRPQDKHRLTGSWANISSK